MYCFQFYYLCFSLLSLFFREACFVYFISNCEAYLCGHAYFLFLFFLTHLFHIFIFLNIHGIGQLAVERAEAFDSPHAYFCRCNVLESIQSERNFLPYLLSVYFFISSSWFMVCVFLLL